MQNFTLNQTRQLYVAAKVNDALADKLDIALGTADGMMFFKYKNADGLISRSDTINVKNITSIKKTEAAKMARPLMAHTIKFDDANLRLDEMIGKELMFTITIHQCFDYDDDNSRSFTIVLRGDAKNTASAEAFHKALAIAVYEALPRQDKEFPLVRVFSNDAEVTLDAIKKGTVTGSADGVVLVEGLQKYVRGKLSGEPAHFTTASRLDDGFLADVPWVAEYKAEPSKIEGHKVLPANYVLADLEYFALGERGDIFRGNNWPNNVDTTYVVDPFSDVEYDVISVEYFWAGGAENVQKSPRLIQVAIPKAESDDLYTKIEAAIA